MGGGDPPAGSPFPSKERLSRIRLIATDVDGTLTDGRLEVDASGGISKAFHVRDGYGGVLLLAAGLRIAILSGRDDPATKARVADLGWETISLGEREKAQALFAFCGREGIGQDEVLYLGDDLNDVGSLAWAGVGCAVGDADATAKEAAGWVLGSKGGEGALREVADALLESR